MNTADFNRLKIRTPEGIDFSLILASPLLRSLALTLDFFVMGVLGMVFSNLLGLLQLAGTDFYQGLMVFLGFAIVIGYGIVLEWCWRGQTLGKRLLHLRVMDAGGVRLSFSQVVIRNLLRAVDGLPLFYAVGGVAALANSRMQRLGDLAAGTIVVWQPPIPETDLRQLTPGKFNSLRGHALWQARLRNTLTADEARIALLSLLRRDTLEAEARVRLFDQLAAHLLSRVPLPETLTAGLLPEQIVRNIVEILFRIAAHPRGNQASSGEDPGTKVMRAGS